MKKLISFTIKAEKGFLKKPDINDGIYLTYNMLHKPAILGILGAIIGLEGYKQNGVPPEYYKMLKDIPVGIEPGNKKPFNHEKGNFQKIVIYYSNTTGFANEGENKSGATHLINEQTLIKPSYKIYLLLDLEKENENKLFTNIKEQKAEYLPYLGKNDYSLWWDKEEVMEYDNWELFVKNSNFRISTVFKKDEAIINYLAKAISRGAIAGRKNDFNYFERLPIGFNEKLFQYDYSDFAYSNALLEEEIKINSANLYNLISENKVVYLY